jgi:hypothetical protein
VRLTPSSFGSERNLHEFNPRHGEDGRFAATGGTLLPGKPRSRPTYPDGRLRPQFGDLVFRAPKGGPVEHGHVTTAANGALRVQLVRGAAVPAGVNPRRQFYQLDDTWSVKGDVVTGL